MSGWRFNKDDNEGRKEYNYEREEEVVASLAVK